MTRLTLMSNKYLFAAILAAAAITMYVAVFMEMGSN
jgi:hypothetical protein